MIPGFCPLGEPAPPGFFSGAVDTDPYYDDGAWELAEELERIEAFEEEGEPPDEDELADYFCEEISPL